MRVRRIDEVIRPVANTTSQIVHRTIRLFGSPWKLCKISLGTSSFPIKLPPFIGDWSRPPSTFPYSSFPSRSSNLRSNRSFIELVSIPWNGWPAEHQLDGFAVMEYNLVPVIVFEVPGLVSWGSNQYCYSDWPATSEIFKWNIKLMKYFSSYHFFNLSWEMLDAFIPLASTASPRCNYY